MITVSLAVMILLSISLLNAAADPGADSGEVITDDGNVDGGSVDTGDGDSAIDSGETPDIEHGEVDNGMGDNEVNEGVEGENNYEEPTISIPDDIQNQYEQIRDDYINRIEDLADNLNQYVPNENLGNLETVAPTDVVMATAEPLPDVAVSDASLFSGIVMWLCVAVGISVVAGVMVSKRTHRRGA